MPLAFDADRAFPGRREQTRPRAPSVAGMCARIPPDWRGPQRDRTVAGRRGGRPPRPAESCRIASMLDPSRTRRERSKSLGQTTTFATPAPSSIVTNTTPLTDPAFAAPALGPPPSATGASCSGLVSAAIFGEFAMTDVQEDEVAAAIYRRRQLSFTSARPARRRRALLDRVQASVRVPRSSARF